MNKHIKDVQIHYIKQLQDGTADRIPQDTISKAGLYCGRRIKGDEIIDWNQSSRNIFNFVRAITYPGVCARTYLGDEEIKIIKVRLVYDAPSYIGIPGQVLFKDAEGFYVKTSDSYVHVIEFEGEIKPKVGDRFLACKEENRCPKF